MALSGPYILALILNFLFLNKEEIKRLNFEYLCQPSNAQSNNSLSEELGSSIAQI